MFQLPSTTKVVIVNVNARPELHGDERVRAVDIKVRLEGENTLLDLIEPGLREHHFCNHAAQARQETLPDVVIPLPNLRFPKLPTKYAYAPKDKPRGYRWIRDFGLGGEGSDLDFTDCVLSGLAYELFEGGSVHLWATVQYNGDELADDKTHGQVTGLATEGEAHIRLIAPPTLQLVKGKNWRSGHPDSQEQPPADPKQVSLEDGAQGPDGTVGPDGALDPDSPEAAFAAATGSAP